MQSCRLQLISPERIRVQLPTKLSYYLYRYTILRLGFVVGVCIVSLEYKSHKDWPVLSGAEYLGSLGVGSPDDDF